MNTARVLALELLASLVFHLAQLYACMEAGLAEGIDFSPHQVTLPGEVKNLIFIVHEIYNKEYTLMIRTMTFYCHEKLHDFFAQKSPDLAIAPFTLTV